MASKIINGWFSATVSPTFTKMRRIVPGIGDGMASAPAGATETGAAGAGLASAAGSLAGAAGAGATGAGATGAAGATAPISSISTKYSLPSTLILNLRNILYNSS